VQSCGVGACRRSVPICQAPGTPVRCEPGTPAAESCNDIDDDCDAVIDEGLPQDSYEPNNSCDAAYFLETVYSVSRENKPSTVTVTPTLYGDGDVDVYHVRFEENDSTCGCGTFSFDEDYAITARLTVPAGAGSYEVCSHRGDSCDEGTCEAVAEGTTGSIQVWLDGCCTLPGCTEKGHWWLHVRPLAAPGRECRQYTLTLSTQQGCR
jgi:hypothetical protein